MLQFVATARAVHIDFFIDTLTTANGEDWRRCGKVCQLVGNGVDLVFIQTHVFCGGVVLDAHLDVISLQRQERHERTDKVPVNHAAVLQTTCVHTYGEVRSH